MSNVIEGRNAVLEALRSGSPVRRILIAEGTKPNQAIEEILSLAQEVGISVQSVARKKLDALSDRGAHQGVMAEAPEFAYALLSDVIEQSEVAKRSLIIVLDHVTDPGNLGAVIRSAEVAGADAVVIPRDRSAGVGPVVFKSSAGAVAHIPVVQETNLVRALDAFKEAGYWVGGATAVADSMLWDAPMDGRLVLVAQATSVLAFEWVRRGRIGE
jgi:23S rRNA (guanosine2251-2'-O)-methyltransferase